MLEHRQLCQKLDVQRHKQLIADKVCLSVSLSVSVYVSVCLSMSVSLSHVRGTTCYQRQCEWPMVHVALLDEDALRHSRLYGKQTDSGDVTVGYRMVNRLIVVTMNLLF